MAKRTATRDINHENWDQEDEPEEAGTFQRAPEEQLKNRVIKTAKRRNLSSQGGESEKTGAFSAFSGFGKPATPSPSAFSFLSNLSKSSEPPKTNGLPVTNNSPMFKTADTAVEKTAEKNSNLDEYYSKLKGLNESVAKCIKNHVETNPFINLQPVFQDYEKYIKDLEKLRDTLEKPSIEPSPSKKEVEKPTTTPASSSYFINPPLVPTIKTSLAFGKLPESAKMPSNCFFPPPSNSNAKSLPLGSTSTTNFNFRSNTESTSALFSFANTGSKPAEKEENKEEEEDTDEPPKPDFTPVVEEGHIYTTRCKVFVKKDNAFTDRGVGNLFLKPVPSSEKVQLIVRADTSLGNLLCNFILSASIPVKRLGKKDVMLVCIPTPDAKPPPVPILLRVVSPEIADELLETLEKHKK